MFTRAIVRTPCRNMVNGLTSATLGPPQYELALAQHGSVIDALRSCGLDVTVLAPQERFPDSTFVEDTAVLIPDCAVITNPGATSRKGETESIHQALLPIFDHIEFIREPGTLDGGDVMAVDSHYYIGLTERTNSVGAEQLISILRRFGLDGETVKVAQGLHLKSSIVYLDRGDLVATEDFAKIDVFGSFSKIIADPDEAYAANCVWINGRVLVAKGFPKLSKRLSGAGYDLIELDVSEFRKLDGGLSCLSLRF